jgi:predicted alpha/beta-fold hydrolase
MKKPNLNLHWEKLALPDGDFIELSWNQKLDQAKGLAVIFHGLEGSVDSHYAAHLLDDLRLAGWDSVLIHFRGCGPGGNQTARSYHSGETTDNLFALKHIKSTTDYQKIIAIGYSLGGNMLLKMLGEGYDGPELEQAIAVSPPFDLAKCSIAISQGFSNVYQTHLLKSMRNKFVTKYHLYDYQKLIGVGLNDIAQMDTFFAFDDKITGPLHGFDNAQHYYQTCSANQFMHNIEVPALVLHAKDDPFMTPDIVPHESQLSPQVTIELSDKGGHVGFLEGSPLNPSLWVNERILRCLESIDSRR